MLMLLFNIRKYLSLHIISAFMISATVGRASAFTSLVSTTASSRASVAFGLRRSISPRRTAIMSTASSSTVQHTPNEEDTADSGNHRAAAASSKLSSRIHGTLDPCVVIMKSLVSKHDHLWSDRGGVVSLAQGVVYWNPPPSCYDTLSQSLNAASSGNLHTYAPADGLPELVSALERKLAEENALEDVSVMVTAGANQAYTNCVLTLLDEGDQGIVFAPYYFNHVMAMQMSRGTQSVLIGPTTAAGIPDLEWLRDTLVRNDSSSSSGSIKMVTVVNPGNPTGVSIPRETLNEVSDLCARHGVWLVMDNTYEHFDHVGANSTPNDVVPFACSTSDHVIHIFSFSKGYSMAGFRVGYLTVSRQGKGPECFRQMTKVQDTVPICVSRVSQTAAVGALDAGRDWVTEKVSSLSTGRDAMMGALSPLEAVIGGTGAMYMMGKLPNGIDDQIVAELLVEKYGVAIIPGSFCGFSGWIRVCYSNLPPDECVLAAKRLAAGIRAIIHDSELHSSLASK